MAISNVTSIYTCLTDVTYGRGCTGCEVRSVIAEEGVETTRVVVLLERRNGCLEPGVELVRHGAGCRQYMTTNTTTADAIKQKGVQQCKAETCCRTRSVQGRRFTQAVSGATHRLD